jgi:tetratricopeptide (TPR) repeat protein
MAAFILAAVLPLAPAFSQNRSGPTNINGIGSVTSPPGMTPPSALHWQLSGHVTFEDGTTPTQPVYVESVCAGSARKEAKIDPKGGFSFRLGLGSGDNLMNADNTASHAATGAYLSPQECVIRASLAGFTSDVVNLVNHEEHHPDIGTIILHKNGEGNNESSTTKAAPKDARKAYDKAVQAVNAKKYEEAVKNCQTAVSLYPRYAEAWFELGLAQTELKQNDEARKSLNASIQADEKYISPYLLLAKLESDGQNWKAAVDITDRLLKLTPSGYPKMYLINAMSNYQLKDAEATEKSARAGIQIDKQNQAPKLYEVLASVYLVRGDYAGAASQLKTYLEVWPTADDAAMVRSQIAQLEARAGTAPAKQ